MTSNLEIEDVIERAEGILTHQEGIEETSLSEVRQPGGLDRRRKKYMLKTEVLQNNIGKLIVDTKREYDLKNDSFSFSSLSFRLYKEQINCRTSNQN